MATRIRLTLDEFLALPETEPPCEFVRGEVVQKPMPSPYHSLLVVRLSRLLDEHVERSGGAFVMSEPRHADRDEDRAYLPDVSVVRASRMPTGHETLARGPLEFAPDIAVEVLSPDDRPSRVSEKVSFYLRAGTEIVWLIDPEERTLTEHRRGDVARIFDETEQVSAAPVLPSFALDLPRLFSALPARPD